MYKLLFIIISLFMVMYSVTKTTEGFVDSTPPQSSAIVTAVPITSANVADYIYTIYKTDVKAIQNLADIAMKLQTGGITVPGNMTIQNTLTVNNATTLNTLTATGTTTLNTLTATGTTTLSTLVVNKIDFNTWNTEIESKIKAIKTTINDSVDYLNTKLNNMNTEIQKITTDIGSFINSMDARINSMNTRINNFTDKNKIRVFTMTIHGKRIEGDSGTIIKDDIMYDRHFENGYNYDSWFIGIVGAYYFNNTQGCNGVQPCSAVPYQVFAYKNVSTKRWHFSDFGTRYFFNENNTIMSIKLTIIAIPSDMITKYNDEIIRPYYSIREISSQIYYQ